MSNRKILLVDDDLVSLAALKNYLQTTSYESVLAHDGQEAWELLITAPEAYAAVIVDRVMPKLHGLQLLAKMREHELLKKIPFILLTAEAEKTEHIAAIQAGVFDFLYKPIDENLLHGVLKRAINQTAS